MDKQLKIFAIETKSGYYITDNLSRDSYFNSQIPIFLFDGKEPKPSAHKDWFIISNKPTLIEKYVGQPAINKRYELVDKTMASEKIPPTLAIEKATYYDDKEYCIVWREEYANLKSLYVYMEDKQPDILSPVEFTFDVIMAVDEIKDPVNGFAYPVQRTDWSKDGLIGLTDRSIKHQLIDQMFFPAPILQERPCELSSVDTYNLVREHIKKNINRQVAEITSDYDFCFTVKKKIKVKPYSYEAKSLGSFFSKRKRKPQLKTVLVTDRFVEVFEMTNDKDNYNGYTVIKGFSGDSHKDLKKNIDSYLADLMAFINMPLVDCDKCNGHGVVIEEKFDLNKR